MATDGLKPNRSERTVLTYVKLDFVGDWEYHGDTYSFRPVARRAELLVVTEARQETLSPIGSQYVGDLTPAEVALYQLMG